MPSFIVRTVGIALLLLLSGRTSVRGQETADIAALADSIITATMQEDGSPGAVFTFVRNGRVEVARGYGLEDVRTASPVSPDSTLFRVGSITKVVTAVAALQLVDDGRLDLHGDVNDRLRSVQVADSLGSIALHHLLSHTAGLDEIRPGTQADSAADVVSLDRFLEARLRPVMPPGSLPIYSTYGITLAGLLVQDVTGEAYESYVRENVLRPAGMLRASLESNRRPSGRLARGYVLEGDQLVEQPYEWYHTTPASSLNATASDMARFAAALLDAASGRDTTLLSRRQAAMMLRPQGRGHPEVPGFAYGFFEGDYAGVRVLEHGGLMAGTTAHLVLLPDLDAAFFVATSIEGSALGASLKTAVIEHLAAHESTPPIVAGNADLSRFAGLYRWATYCRSCGAAPTQGPRVTANADGTLGFAGQRWVPVGPLVFRRDDGRRVLGFREGSDGEITHLFIDGPVTFERIVEER